MGQYAQMRRRGSFKHDVKILFDGSSLGILLDLMLVPRRDKKHTERQTGYAFC